MKVLILGNSNDTGTFVPESAKRHVHMREMLAEEFGVPVEIVVRNVWPNERMVDYVVKGVEEIQPDMVYVNVTNYPYSYESTPLKVKRIFGKVGGEKLGDAGLRAADSRKWSHNAVFRGMRRAAQATIGGDTHFTPEEVIDRYQRLIRALLRQEGMVVAVKGPMGKSKKATARATARAERRRQIVHTSLRQFCQQLHVFYLGSDLPYHDIKPTGKGTRVGDGLHSNPEGHRISADEHFEVVRDAWRKHLDAEARADASATAR